MKKIVEHKLHFKNDTIKVEVSTHKDFIQCKKGDTSFFKSVKNTINPEINIDAREKVVIKCFISNDERKKIINKPLSEITICHNVIGEFIKSNWNKGEQLIQMESLHCNKFDKQYKFVIITRTRMSFRAKFSENNVTKERKNEEVG